jgi:hypothetical protein
MFHKATHRSTFEGDGTMHKPLSVAERVRLVRRYIKAPDDARRERVAEKLSTELTALAKQGAILHMAVDILLAGEYPNEEELVAIEDLTLDPELLESLRLYGIEDQWNATLPQRVLMYEAHFGQVKLWLDEWPNIEEHIDLMQLGDDGPHTEMLGAGFGQIAHALGFHILSRPQRSGNRPVTDEVINWRIEAVVGWIRQWPDIESLIYLLLPEIAHSVVSLLGNLLDTVPTTLHAATEYKRLVRKNAAEKYRLLMATTNNPPTA